MKRLVVLLCALLVIGGVFTANADWVRQSLTQWVDGHYENEYRIVGYTYNSWTDWYTPVWQWVSVWYPGHFHTYYRMIWVPGHCQ